MPVWRGRVGGGAWWVTLGVHGGTGWVVAQRMWCVG